jgi:HB1, ASXL, restriction endonuclease HTH domain
MASYESRPIQSVPAVERLDSYLNIAETVLGQARRPLSPREILTRAYTTNLVPSHLFGQTQHKTLGARLSEDILVRRERSAFFRTNPGYFFLRRFLTDVSLPEKFRTPIIARRRERELQRGTVLCLSAMDVSETHSVDLAISVKLILNLLRSNRFHYLEGKERTASDIMVWSFVVIARKTKVLTYRIGRYRDGRDSFLQKRSVGFFRPVRDTDRTLFDLKDHGIVSSGVRAASLDLDLPQDVMGDEEYRKRSDLSCFLFHKSRAGVADLLALIRFECPDWFEPTKRRLAINDLQWLDLKTPINYIEDFDPWSQLALVKLIEHLRRYLVRG